MGGSVSGKPSGRRGVENGTHSGGHRVEPKGVVVVPQRRPDREGERREMTLVEDGLDQLVKDP